MLLDGIMWLWYVLTALSAIYLIWDQFVNTPSLRIMTLAWFLVILYTGPIGLFFYFTSCRQPLPGTHDAFIKAHWKQALGSEIHCVAGDATGIIISAFIMSFFPIPNGWETIIEYVFAYLFGLLLFQALFMLSMFKSYGQAVYKTIFAETVSMNFVMMGMLPLVVILRHVWPAGKDPSNAEFWFIMSIATLGGFIIGYPINSYLVHRKEKHGMMSRPSGQTASTMTQESSTHKSHEHHCCKHGKGDECKCKGHHDHSKKPEEDHHHDQDKTPAENPDQTKMPAEHHHDQNKSPHEHHDSESHEMDNDPKEDHFMQMDSKQGNDGKAQGHGDHGTHMDHEMGGNMKTGEKWAWVFGSYVILIAIFWIISVWIPIRFT